VFCQGADAKIEYLLLFIVARSRMDRYEELRRQLDDHQDVRVILDRREGERREPHDAFAGVDRRRLERRRRLDIDPYRKLGWSMVDTEELVS
jgi:hypothetical protein